MVTAERVGRWPANVMLDEEAAVLLDAQTGELTSGKWNGKRNAPKTVGICGPFAHGMQDERGTAGDSGGASRFFYCAKASRKERNAGEVENKHPTVKPLALMRWLCRLVTPPNGLVLDPFTGSGTTGCAAVAEGFRFLGCELSEEYVAIARARIAHWQESEAA